MDGPRGGPRAGAAGGLAVSFATLGFVILLASGAFNTGGHADNLRVSSPPIAVASAVLPIALDNAITSIAFGNSSILVNDTITYGVPKAAERSYTISVRTSHPIPLWSLEIETNPLNLWSIPGQMPGGPDALPPMADWRWTVTDAAGLNDTSNWTIPRWTHDLARFTNLTTQSYVVTGYSTPVVPVQVNLPLLNSTPAPGLGIVFNPGSPSQGPLYPASDSDYANMVHSLKPTLIRFGTVDGNTSAHWNSTNGVPIFNFSALDRTFNLSAQVGAKVLYSVSAGTWGDGNLLPLGMPVNTTYLIVKGATSGYYADPVAYRSYVQAIVNHIQAMNQSVGYWTIGNEIPLTNVSVVDEFIQLFNIAEQVIHATFPAALVGSDVMMDRTYFSDFVNNATHVGFLSFHFYPATGICVNNGTYCPPAGPGFGTLDGRLWQPVADISHVGFIAPHLAQQMWFNVTHHWLPVIDAESNLNGIGGGASSGANGSDPRQQTLLGAAWAAATLIRGAAENLSTFTYFTMTGPSTTPTTVTGPYGGWGFGLTSEGLNDTDVRYAPYWALRMWSQNVPAGAPGVSLPSPDPFTARAYAVRTAIGVNVILVNLVAVRVSIPVFLNATGFGARVVTTLDQNTYRMDYNESSYSVALHRSGVARIGMTGTITNVTVSLNGYGVAVVKFVHVRPGHAPFIVPPSTMMSNSRPVPAPSWWGVPSSASPPIGGVLPRLTVSPSPFGLPNSAVVGSNGFVAAPARGRHSE